MEDELTVAEGRDESAQGDTLTLQAATGFTFGELEHPNKMPFSGVLTFLGVPSDAPPGGAKGRKVLIPVDVGTEALASLQGMAINYVPDSMDGHNPQQKIGVIEAASLGDPQANGAVPVRIEGYIYASDFQEAAEKIKRYQDFLGFSYETARTKLVDGEYEGESVAIVASLGHFTGASVLWKDSAAYRNTSLAAAAEEEKEENNLDFEKLLAAAVKEIKTYVDEKIEAAKTEETVEVTEEVVEETVTEEVEETVEETVETVEEVVETVEETTVTEGEEELNAAALKAELDAVKAELAEVKNEASIQAAARKSVAYPTTLMAKYAINEEDEESKIMASIDARTDLSVEERMALKIEARDKANKK